MTTDTTPSVDWYARRDELRPDMAFVDADGDLVRLDRHVEGDGTRWHVHGRSHGGWIDDGATIEPGDLVALVTADEERP